MQFGEILIEMKTKNICSIKMFLTYYYKSTLCPDFDFEFLGTKSFFEVKNWSDQKMNIK